MNDPIDDRLMREAIDRIARTADGVLLYRFLQRELMGVVALSESDPQGALRQHHGRRSFARDVMAMMAKGIDESDARDSADTSFSGRPVVFKLAGNAAVSSTARGTSRRVSAADAAQLYSNTDPSPDAG